MPLPLLRLFLRRHARGRLVLWLALAVSSGAALAAWSLHRGVMRQADEAVAALGGENTRLLSPAPLSFLGLDLASLRSEPFPDAAVSDILQAFPGHAERIRVPADAVELEAELFGQRLSTETALLIVDDRNAAMAGVAHDGGGLRFVVPRMLLDLFNQAYAPSRGMPGLDEEALRAARCTLTVGTSAIAARCAGAVDGLPMPAPAIRESDWRRYFPGASEKTILVKVRVENAADEAALAGLAARHKLKVKDPAEDRAQVQASLAPLSHAMGLVFALLFGGQAGLLLLLWKEELRRERRELSILSALGLSRSGLLALSAGEGMLWGIWYALATSGFTLLLVEAAQRTLALGPAFGLPAGSAPAPIGTWAGLLLVPVVLEMLRGARLARGFSAALL